MKQPMRYHAPQFESRWTPWKPGGPYVTKVPESKTTMEDWIKAMEASDDGMCKGWRDQIDTLIHGLRYRGLQAWRVPEIIASLPILLQTALVLFLLGILALLWPFQKAVASLTTVIVGLTFLFLGITTILPSIQYIYPKFDTQCAYKSSQSWSFFLISTFWLFDFSRFTSWAAFDRWEVNSVYPGAGHTLSRVYALLSNNIDVFLGIYNFLAGASLTPSTEADVNILSDFVDGLDISRRNAVIKGISSALPGSNGSTSLPLQRTEQLKGYIDQYYHFFGKLRPELMVASVSFVSSFSQPKTPTLAYRSRIQKTFHQFLKGDNHVSNQVIFNRYVEHWIQSFDGLGEGTPWMMGDSDEEQWSRTIGPFSRALIDETKWEPDIASHLVQMHSHLLKTDQYTIAALYSLSAAYSGLMESHRRTDCEPPPFTLLGDIQDWINRMPETDLATKSRNVIHLLSDLVLGDNVFVGRPQSRSSCLEVQQLVSLAQFLVDFNERRDVVDYHSTWETHITNKALPILRTYLDQHRANS